MNGGSGHLRVSRMYVGLELIKFFALSSGTSEASSKYIPITKELIRANTLTSFRQLISLASYNNVPKKYVGKGWLMLGGSTHLQKTATYYAGDLSGIQAKNIPFWFQGMYKPGKKIAKVTDWSKKLNEIVEKAPEWDIAFLVGVPAWVQLCMEKVIERYELNNIHEIWPNLAFYVHGGVALEPYKKGFNKLLGKPITYIETYLASEGFLAYQNRQNAKGMRLATNNNIFFEFVPFDQNNFDMDGNMVENPANFNGTRSGKMQELRNIDKHQCRYMALPDRRYCSICRCREIRNCDNRPNQTFFKSRRGAFKRR